MKAALKIIDYGLKCCIVEWKFKITLRRGS